MAGLLLNVTIVQQQFRADSRKSTTSPSSIVGWVKMVSRNAV